jgi:hypothetical protein
LFKPVVIPGLDETDEVVEIKKLHQDIGSKELYFAVVLRMQHSITICKVDFTDQANLKVIVQSKQIVREKFERKEDLYENYGKIKWDDPTELQHFFSDELAIQQKRLLYKTR